MSDDIAVGADRLWAQDSGGAGEPLILLHPGIADSRVWDAVWDELSQDYRVIRYDVRGYGRSPAATESYDWAGDLAAVMDHFGISSAHLLGNSNGGATALALAATTPERVRSMVLLAPGVPGFEYPPEPELEERAAELDVTDGEAVLQFILDLWCSAGQGSPVREWVAATATIDDAASAHFQPLPDIWESLGSVATPTVVMVGDMDPSSMIAGCRALAERMPAAKLVEMPGVDHLPQVRRPDEVIATVRAHCR